MSLPGIRRLVGGAFSGGKVVDWAEAGEAIPSSAMTAATADSRKTVFEFMLRSGEAKAGLDHTDRGSARGFDRIWRHARS